MDILVHAYFQRMGSARAVGVDGVKQSEHVVDK